MKESNTTSASVTMTEATRLTRLKDRGHYDYTTINHILDDGILCHIGFEWEGRQIVLPTAYARHEQQVIIHGAVNGRFFKALANGAPCCLTVSHLDGLVLARSAFHHSVNYRCVMLMGKMTPLLSLEDKRTALDHFMRVCIPGRLEDNIRPSSDKELNATAVLTMDITEASAKVRTGGPKDDDSDMQLPVWAGVIEKQPSTYQSVTDANSPVPVDTPDYIDALRF